jgi:hypothetical protein
MPENNYPKLHNATWPGIVGKGEGSEPPISFDDMLAMTAAAEVDGVKFDGVDLGLLDPHISIESSDDDIKNWQKKWPLILLRSAAWWRHLGWPRDGQ